MDDEANDELFGTGPSDEPSLDTKPKKKKSKKLNLDDEAGELADEMGELDLGGKKKKKNKVDFMDDVESVSKRRNTLIFTKIKFRPKSISVKVPKQRMRSAPG